MATATSGEPPNDDDLSLQNFYGTKSRVSDLERVHCATVAYFHRQIRELESRLQMQITDIQNDVKEQFERLNKRIRFLEADLNTLRDPVIGGCGSPLPSPEDEEEGGNELASS